MRMSAQARLACFRLALDALARSRLRRDATEAALAARSRHA